MSESIITEEMAADYKSEALQQLNDYVAPDGLQVDIGPARCVIEVGDKLFAAGDYENAGYRYSAAAMFVLPSLELLARLRSSLDADDADGERIVAVMKMIEGEVRSAHWAEPDSFYFLDLREDWADIQSALKQLQAVS